MNSVVLQVDALAYGGDGVGRLDNGKVCFVPGTLPGETAAVEIIQDKRSFARGKVTEILKAAPERIEPECRFYRENNCPGCAYLHCSYPFELEWKQRQFAAFLERDQLLAEGVMLEPFPSPRRLGCRNKLKLRSGKNSFAMVGADNESLIAIDRCLLADERINEAMKNSPLPSEGEEMTWRVTGEDGVKSFIGKRCSARLPWLTEELGGYGKFKVAQDGFFQTNTDVAAELVRRVVQNVSQGGYPQLVELYCGVGIFSIAAAERLPELQCVGVELNNTAVKVARWNAAKHQVNKRCRFFSGDAGELVKKVECAENSCLLLDPPRTGLAKNALENILRLNWHKIIYISCAADTLRRDLLEFRKAGWMAETAGILDMFPATAHFESLVSLIRT